MNRLALAAALLASTTSIALAQTSASSPLTLSAAIAQADANNLDIAAARRAVDVARGVLTQTAPSPLQAQVAPGVTQDVPQGLGVLQTFSASASQQFLPAIGAQRSAATSGVEVALAQFAAVRRDVDVRVATTYYALASAQAVVAAAAASVENAKQLEEGAALRAKVGAVGSFEVLRAQVELRRAQTDLLRAQAAERSEQIALDVLLGVPTEQRNAVALPATTAPVANTQSLYAKAERIDPLLAQYRASISQARALKRAAMLQRAPTVGLSGGYLFQRVPGIGGAISRGGTASVTFSLPLFDYGTIRGAAREAQARGDVARAQFQGRDAQLHADIEQTVGDIESARARLEFSRASLDQAHEALRLAQFGYARGALGVLDVLSARNELAAAQSEVTQASADFGASVAHLALIVGEPITP